ncbi:SGNH/GDSL hydrolase family protein [Novosphingobium aquimarinum]|uniref:SGNH/GDSL hydrolase family protein n=1 Tax=Novosphingobium aquimarinum TaxID=2682494 RepID=UPI0018DC9684|nr:SGNH/GDSL hydrolase family protein [Novosphingobium aquimarinum]
MKISALAVALIAALAASACSGPATVKAASPALTGDYVALGASYSAGPGLGEIKPGSPTRCAQTMGGFPTLLAEDLRLALFDMSCSGATSQQVLTGWNELPPQIDALTPETTLVTVNVGGNDLNYVGNFFSAGCAPDGTAQVSGRKFTCPVPRKPTEAQFAAVEANLREIAKQVRARSPKARLVFVPYLTLLPSEPCPAAPIDAGLWTIASETADRLSRMSRQVAKESGALLVPIDTESREHTACDSVAWTNGRKAAAPGDGIAWHPNRAGMRATAAAILAALGPIKR